MIFNFLYTSIIKLKARLQILDNFSTIYKDLFIPTAIQIILSKVPVMPDSYVIWTGNSNFDSSLNLMKTKCFHFLNNMVSSLKNKQNEESELNTLYFSLLEETTKNLSFIVQNKLEFIYTMDKESSNFPDNYYEGLMVQMLDYLNTILLKDNNYLIFSNDCKRLFPLIIFPLLITTKKEFINMKDDGQYYQVFSAELVEAKVNDLSFRKIHIKFLKYKCVFFSGT